MPRRPKETLWGMALLYLLIQGCNLNDQNDKAPMDTESEPERGETDSMSIWIPAPYDGADSEHPYHACEEAVATGDAPLISNFDDGKLRVLQNEGRSGGWQTTDDGTGGTLTVDIESGALHIVSSGWTDWGAGVGVVIAPSLSDTEHCLYDASYYVGIRFRAKGTGELLPKVGTVANYPTALGGTCERPGSNCYDRPTGKAGLTDEWQTFEFPFCVLKPQGWGGDFSPPDPAAIIDIYFMLTAGQEKEVWIDDLEFFSSESAEGGISCESPCPMALVPHPETIVPEESWVTLTDELTLHTFDQETTSCGTLRRRYLSYVPGDMETLSSAPVVIGLHGTMGNAEAFQQLVSFGRFDELATRDGFVVVYGNAAPGSYSSDNPQWMNTGTWRHAHVDDGEVDDVEYLEMVLEDLAERDVISGDNDIYLVGFSNGGGMALKAAKERPEMWRGIASFMSFDGWEPTPVPDLRNTGLGRVLFAYTSTDPRLPDGYYDAVLTTLPATWAEALGLPEEVIQNPIETAIPNLVNEGEGYTGDNPIALKTQNSSVTQVDFSSPDVSGRLRLLSFEHAGHYWPTPMQDDSVEFAEIYGFTNQDLDASDVVWEFFVETFQ